jgi:hypothetical protein
MHSQAEEMKEMMAQLTALIGGSGRRRGAEAPHSFDAVAKMRQGIKEPDKSSGYHNAPRRAKHKHQTEQPIPLEDDDFKDF